MVSRAAVIPSCVLVACALWPWANALAREVDDAARAPSEAAEGHPGSSGSPSERPTEAASEQTEEAASPPSDSGAENPGEPAATMDPLEALLEDGDPRHLLEVAEQRLEGGDGPGAVEALSRYLHEVGQEADDRNAIEERIASLRAAPTVVRLVTEPSGASIQVDDQAVEGATPIDLELAPGQHTLRVLLEGHEALERRVVVPFASRREIEVSLRPISELVAGDPRFGEGEAIDALPEETTAAEGADEAEAGTAVWVTAGISVGTVVTGTILGFLALAEESDFELEPSAARADRGERLALFADLSFGIAAASGLTAIVLFLLPDESEEGAAGDAQSARARLLPTVGRREVGLLTTVEF